MRKAVSAAFVGGWATAEPGAPLVLENESLPLTDTFALLTINLTTSSQTTMGRAGMRRVRRDGWFTVKLWTPADHGAHGAAALADLCRDLLEMIDIASPAPNDEPLTTGAGYTQPVGIGGDSYMCLVRVPFWYVETK